MRQPGPTFASGDEAPVEGDLNAVLITFLDTDVVKGDYAVGQVAPVEDLLLGEIARAGLLHLDETPWRESGELLWLWVFNAVTHDLLARFADYPPERIRLRPVPGTATSA